MSPKRDIILATTLISTGMVGLHFAGQIKPGPGKERCVPAQSQPPSGLDCPDIGCIAPPMTCNEDTDVGSWSDGDCYEGTSVCEESTNSDKPRPIWKCTSVDCEMEGGADGKACAIVDTGTTDPNSLEDNVQSCNGGT